MWAMYRSILQGPNFLLKSALRCRIQKLVLLLKYKFVHFNFFPPSLPFKDIFLKNEYKLSQMEIIAENMLMLESNFCNKEFVLWFTFWWSGSQEILNIVWCIDNRHIKVMSELTFFLLTLPNFFCLVIVEKINHWGSRSFIENPITNVT